MSDKHPPGTAILPSLMAVCDALARDREPPTAFRALDAALQDILGHQLFTVFVMRGGGMVERVYSSRPESYPVGGLKRMGPTPWGDLVLGRGQTFLGRDRAAIRWAFPDHDLIESLGLGSVLNASAILGGDVLGTANVLDREGAYREEWQVEVVRVLMTLLTPVLLRLRG